LHEGEAGAPGTRGVRVLGWEAVHALSPLQQARMDTS